MAVQPTPAWSPAEQLVIVYGGGCYGRFHVTHLLQARRAGRMTFDRLVVVDRNADPPVRAVIGTNPDITLVQDDWVTFSVRHLVTDRVNPASELVLPCIGPHLFLAWLARDCQQNLGFQVTPLVMSTPLATPVDIALETGDRAASFATWQCPPACVEPAVCPGIAGPRTWQMPDFIRRRLAADPTIDLTAVIVSTHRTDGVATVPLARYRQLRRKVISHLEHCPETIIAVATVSLCHGLVGKLHLQRP